MAVDPNDPVGFLNDPNALKTQDQPKKSEMELENERLAAKEREIQQANKRKSFTVEEPDQNPNAGNKGTENPPALTKGRVQDNNLTNQDGQPLENNPIVTGDTGVGSPTGFRTNPDGTVDIRIPVNDAAGTSASSGIVDRDHPERMEDRDRVVVDKVSGNPVMVRARVHEDKRKEFEEKMSLAHDSLKGANIGEIGLTHPYWHLMEQARQFGKSYGLI